MGRPSKAQKRGRKGLFHANAGLAAKHHNVPYQVVKEITQDVVPERASTKQLRGGLELAANNPAVKRLREFVVEEGLLNQGGLSRAKRVGSRVDILQRLSRPESDTTASCVVAAMNYDETVKHIGRAKSKVRQDITWEVVQLRWEVLRREGSHAYGSEVSLAGLIGVFV
jgi:hypothetical protein